MKTILFDLDGTLIDSPPWILKSFQKTFNQFLPSVKLDEQTLTNFLGQTLWQTFNAYTNDIKLVDEMIAYYRKTSDDLISKHLKAYPNAKKTIRYLKSKGCHIGVVTSKLNDVAERHLKLCDLFDDIDVLIGYDDVSHHKPHPDSIYKAIAYFKSSKEQTIYIGDHENDIKAANNAGILSCAVTYSIRLKEMLVEQPTYVIDEIKNLEDLV